MTSHQDPDILRQHEKGMRSRVLRASSRRLARAFSVFLQRVPVSGNGSDTRWCFLPVLFLSMASVPYQFRVVFWVPDHVYGLFSMDLFNAVVLQGLLRRMLPPSDV